MLKSELHQLEMLIGEIVNSNENTDNETRLRELGNGTGRIAAICDTLRLNWVQELFSNVKETIILRYVQYHQAGIISLSDQIYAELPPLSKSGLNEQVQAFYRDAISQLEGLLKFLEKSFYRYFDLDHTVSADQCQKDTVRIQNHLDEIAVQLTASEIEAKLISAISLSITDKLESALQTGISFRQIGYLKGLLRLLGDSVVKPLDKETLSAILFRQNFNSYYFERWYQKSLLGNIDRVSKKNKDLAIQNEIDALQSRFVDRHLSFDSELPPINDSLIDWLKLQFGGTLQVMNKIAGKINGHDRMPLNFSVAQFALFIRLCYLEGCFHINNISNILRFFTSHFETKKQLNISLKSFGRAFYGADQATAAVVRDFLQRMINVLNKTYFP